MRFPWSLSDNKFLQVSRTPLSIFFHVENQKTAVFSFLFFSFFILLNNTKSGLLVRIRGSIYIFKFRMILYVSFSWTDSGLCLYCYILAFDPAKNDIQSDAPEGSDTFQWQLWEEIAQVSSADNMGQGEGSTSEWCTGREWPVNCMTVISTWERSNMPFQRLSGRSSGRWTII